jgi:hypothetical protein
VDEYLIRPITFPKRSPIEVFEGSGTLLVKLNSALYIFDSSSSAIILTLISLFSYFCPFPLFDCSQDMRDLRARAPARFDGSVAPSSDSERPQISEGELEIPSKSSLNHGRASNI